MGVDLTIAASGAYGLVGGVQGGLTLDERRARAQDQAQTQARAESSDQPKKEPQFSALKPVAPVVGLPKGLTDGAELAVAAETPPPPPAAPNRVASAYGEHKPQFESVSERKLREAFAEPRGVKPREVPPEPDPQNPPHARAAREIRESDQQIREQAQAERVEKEQRVLEILRHPDLHGFPKDV